MSQLIDQLKAASGDPRSTRELTLVFGDQTAQSGRQDVFAANPDFASEYAAIKDEIARANRPSLGQEFVGGLKAGGNELAAAGWGLGALGANAIGADSLGQNLLARAQADEQAAQSYQPSVPSISNISGDHPIEDSAYYAARGLGGLIPSLGLAAGATVAGGLLGTAAEPGGGTIAGALGGLGEAFTGEGAAAKLIQLAAEKGVQLSVKDAAALAAKQTVQRIGAETALTGAFAGQSTGANYVRHPETPGADIGFGVASGVLGALAPGYLANRVLAGAAESAVPATYLQRFIGEAEKTIPIGAAGTAGSALTDIAAEKYARGESPTDFTANDWRSALNAGVLGALGGAVMAPFAAIPGGARESAAPEPKSDQGGTPAVDTNVAPESAPAPKIDTTGLPDDIASAVKAAEDTAQAINPSPQPSTLREAANRALSQQSTGEVGVRDTSTVGAGVGQGNAQPEGTTAARESGTQVGQTETPALKPLDTNWRITVQSAMGDIPGYVQIDKIGANGEGLGSFAPEDLRAQGYDVPDVSQLPTGQYDAGNLIKPRASDAAIEEPKVAIPTAQDVMPVPKEVARTEAAQQLSTAPAATAEPASSGYLDVATRPPGAVDESSVTDRQPSDVTYINDDIDRLLNEFLEGKSKAQPEASLVVPPNAELVGSTQTERPIGQAPAEPVVRPIVEGQPDYYRAPKPLSDSLGSIPEILAYRKERLDAYRRLLTDQIGISDGQASYLMSLLDREADTSRFERSLTADQKQKFEQFFEGPLNQKGGPFDDWVSGGAKDPAELAVESDKHELANYIVDALGKVNPLINPEPSDRFISPVVALNRLRDVGATWRDIGDALIGKLKRMGAGDDSPELYRAYGSSIKEFADKAGINLANGELPSGEETLLATKRVSQTSADYIAPPSSAVRLLDSTVRALAQDRGIAVAPIESAITDGANSAIKTAGLTLTPVSGQKVVAYAVDAVHGPLNVDSIVSLLHESAHAFTDGLPEPLRVSAQRAIDELPWTAQRWLNNPEALDARLLATADPATLSEKQQAALRQMTPQEIAAARALPPDQIAAERMAEHLAQLGWDKQTATTFVDRLFRFVKDLWLQTAMAIQRVLKGADQTNPELARQFVENRFLQFINRDAAYATDRINDLRNWIGIPQTTRERQPNFPGGSDNEMRMQYADPETGTLIPISYGTYTPDSMRAYLQRAIDNAARYVRENPTTGQTEDQIAFTKRVNFSKPLPLEPSATVNVKLASVNLEDEIYHAIRRERDIAGQLPRTNGQLPDHATFLKDWLRLPKQQHPEAMKSDVLATAQRLIDPTTGKPVAHNPAIRVNELPSFTETLIGKEKEAQSVKLSEQQDEALKQTILSLRDTQRRVQATLTREKEQIDSLLAQRTKAGAQFPKKAQDQLDALQRSSLLRADIVRALLPRINELESKFDPRRSVNIYPTAEYLRVPSADADEQQILAHQRGVVPRDLNFSTDAAKAKLGQDLADMEAWLAVPENRNKGPIYGSMQETYRKLIQIPTDLKRVNTTVLLRRTITNGLAEELRLTGIPALRAFGKRLIEIARITNENRVETHNQGVKWEVAFAKFAKSLGQEPDQTFRDTWWDPLNRIWDRVDVSRRAELTSPDQWRTPIDLVAKQLSDVAGLEIKTPEQRTALRDLMLATTDANRTYMSIELQNNIKVKDDELGYERRLVPRGIVGGRRTIARHLMGLFARMNPDWSDTSFVSPEDTRSFWDAAPDLYSENRALYDQRIEKLFPSYVTDDFVAPWANDNDPVFPAPKTADDSTPRLASPLNARQAWSESSGDITKFAEILHRLEGGDPQDAQQTVGNVLRTLRQKFYEQKTAVDQQLGRQSIGSEIMPRQLMDARVAHNWPAEHVSYATYGPVDNALVLNQLAMGAALGHDAIGANSEMHQTIAETKRDMAELWSRHEEMVQRGMTPRQIEAAMGKDDANIARNYYALTENINNIERAIVGMTTHNGYLLNDFKAMNAAVSLFSSMMVQNPRSGAVNIIGDIQGPLAALKFSSQGLRAFRDATTSVGRDMATAIVRAFGIDSKFNTNLAHEMYVNGAVEPEAAVTWRQKQHFGAGLTQTKPAGYEGIGTKIARNVVRLAARGREIAPNVGSPFQVPFRAGDEAAAVAPKLRAGFFGTTAMSTQFANNRAGYNLFAELAQRGVKYLNSLPDTTRHALVRELELGTKDIDARQLGYNRGLLLNDEAAFNYLKNAVETQMSGESSVGRFVAKAFRRQEAANGGTWPILSNSQFSDIINLTNSYWTLQSNFATLPPWMNGPLRPLFIFLTWPYQAMHRFGQSFTDPQGRLTFRGTNSTVADGMKSFFLLGAPATIAGSFAIDLYDKYALGKKQNLRETNLATALPGVGAAVDPAAFMERIGRYGSAGFATDLLNRIVNYDTQRNLSLDDRIVAVSAIESLLNAAVVEPFQTRGNLTYASTVRPFLQAIGGGGVLQYEQIMAHLLGLNNQEAAINAQINATNLLRAAGRELGGVSIRTMSGPMEAPSPMSPYVRQMSLGAIADNPELFQAAYQNALAVARSEGKDEKYVAEAFLARHPLRRPFSTVPTDTQYRQMIGLMGDSGQDVQTAVRNFNKYATAYFNRPEFYGRVEKDAPSIDQLIRQAMQLTPSLGINSELATP